jgi:ferritin-like metal-binding protein YciE
VRDEEKANEEVLEMTVADVRELFVRELGDIYDAEHRFLEGQRELAQQASDPDLEEALQRHIEQTEQHIRNLEQVYERVGHDPERLSSEAAQGLVNKAREDLEEAQGPAMRDCAINGAVVRVEYFEIGVYRRLLVGAELINISKESDKDLPLRTGDKAHVLGEFGKYNPTQSDNFHSLPKVSLPLRGRVALPRRPTASPRTMFSVRSSFVRVKWF